jgi:hypothetical protein
MGYAQRMALSRAWNKKKVAVRLPSRRLCQRLAERRMPEGSWAATNSLQRTLRAGRLTRLLLPGRLAIIVGGSKAGR